jgi:tetratricopeptide (TPR) repeat protein
LGKSQEQEQHMPERVLRLFISSPGDVAEERRRVELVVARLNAEFEKRVTIKVVRWETEYYSAHDTFQRQIPEAAECEVVIAIFRARLGTELPPNFPRLPNGEPYPSGTAYEVLSAIAARKGGKELPDVYVFRYPQPPSIRLDDPEEAIIRTQWERLKLFFDTWFKTPSGQFLAAFQNFASTDEFAEKLEDCLRHWLERHGFKSEAPFWDRLVDGTPFPGLAAFDATRQRVFFGRELAIAHALARLRGAGAQGMPFLLLIGASGSGKSSFLRAGLMPGVMRPGAIPEVDLWLPAFAVMGADPVLSLVDALFEPGAIGDELREGDFRTKPALAGLFTGNAEIAMVPVRTALERAAAKWAAAAQFASPRPARLLLGLDQLERVFLEADHARVEEFAGIVAALVRRQLAYVIAVLRSDAYPQFQAVGNLRDLRQGGATYDLVAPAPAELEEIVTSPVEACRPPLAFETRNGRFLAAVLVADAKGGDTLPLLQMTLARLFDAEAARGDGLLRFDDYPGMDAAVARTAEEALATAGAASGAQVPALVTALVRDVAVDSTTGAAVPIVAPLERAAFERGQKDRAVLIDAFVANRLLTLEGDEQAARARPVHDALLRTWPQAVAIIAENTSLIRVRRTLEPIVREWSSAAGPNKARHLELSPALLDAAQQLERRFGDDLPEEMRAFIGQCVAADVARRSRERQRQRIALIATFAALIIVASLGVAAWRQRNAAEHNFKIALGMTADLVQQVKDKVAVEGVSRDVAKGLLGTAQRTFGQLGKRHTPELDDARIRLLLVFSEVQADLEGALGFAREAEALARSRLAGDPDNTEAQGQMADAFDRIGDISRAQGDPATAAQEYKNEFSVLVRLSTASPAADLKRRIWSLREKIGDNLRLQGDLVQALEEYNAALAAVTPADSTDPDVRRDFALSRDKIALVLWQQGRRAEAVAELRESLAIWDALGSSQRAEVMRVVGRNRISAATAADLGAQNAPPALLPDFLLPASADTRLSDQDLAGLGREVVWLARNEIFARHGRYFNNPVLVGYFSQFKWYRPYTWITDLKPEETSNVNLLLRLEEQATPTAIGP